MQSRTFYVKDKSLEDFFNLFTVATDGFSRRDRGPIGGNDNVYSLMKDEIYIKKSSGFTEGEKIKFELYDYASMSRKELVNSYVYVVKPYDDISVKLVLIEFTVELRSTAGADSEAVEKRG